MNFSARDKRTVKIGAAVLAAALALKFAVLPALNGWRDARRQVSAYKARLVNVQQMLDERAMTRQILWQKYGDAADAPLPGVEEARVDFPQAVQQALRSGGMNVQSVQVPSVRSVRELPGVSMVTVRVDGTCEGGQVARVLASLRSCAQVAVVERFETSMAQPGNRQSWNIRLTICTPALQGAMP